MGSLQHSKFLLIWSWLLLLRAFQSSAVDRLVWVWELVLIWECLISFYVFLCVMSFVSWFNNPSPGAAYMRQWIRLALLRMMACRLFAPGLCLGQCWVIVNWNRFQFVSCFNHLPLVPHICVSESGQHWFGWWLVAYSAPGLCLGQCWVSVSVINNFISY